MVEQVARVVRTQLELRVRVAQVALVARDSTAPLARWLHSLEKARLAAMVEQVARAERQRPA